VTIENDANAAAWGEFRFGAGKDVENLILVTLGTGVGGGVISHGVLLRASGGQVGSWGIITVHAAGPRCGCGNRGCLEALASGTAKASRAQKRRWPTSDRTRLWGGSLRSEHRSGKTCSILHVKETRSL
jgi:glucokinase